MVTLRVAAGTSPLAFHDGWLVNWMRVCGSRVRISRSASCTSCRLLLAPGRYVNMAVMAPGAPMVRAYMRTDTNRYPVDVVSSSAAVWKLCSRVVRIVMYVCDVALVSLFFSM